MSKFDHELVYDKARSRYGLAVSREKYTMIEAEKLAWKEWKGSPLLGVREGWVRFRAGRDEYGETRVEWYFETEQHARSCPCWIFVPAQSTKVRGYTYITKEKK